MKSNILLSGEIKSMSVSEFLELIEELLIASQNKNFLIQPLNFSKGKR